MDARLRPAIARVVAVVALLLSSNIAMEAAPVKIKHAVEPIRQPSAMSCWAAASAMLLNWKSVVPRTIDEVLKTAGSSYVAIYKASFHVPPVGISPKDELAFYSAVSLAVKFGVNPSISGWEKLLIEKGPLSVTVDANPGKGFIHALVVTGLDGDGTAANTIVTYIDPSDGQSHDVAFSQFLKLYEGSASWPLQIIHNP